jgi:hypothetical protein
MLKNKDRRTFNMIVLSFVTLIVAVEGFLVASAVAGQPNSTFVAAVDKAFSHSWDSVMPGR